MLAGIALACNWGMGGTTINGCCVNGIGFGRSGMPRTVDWPAVLDGRTNWCFSSLRFLLPRCGHWLGLKIYRCRKSDSLFQGLLLVLFGAVVVLTKEIR